MHVPDHCAIASDRVQALLSARVAGDLMTATDLGVLATLVPFVHDPGAGPHGTLLGRSPW